MGKALQRRLAEDGITRVGELARIGEAELVARYDEIGRRLFLHSRDEDDRPVDPAREAKSISSGITLDEDMADLEQLRPVRNLSDRLGLHTMVQMPRNGAD